RECAAGASSGPARGRVRSGVVLTPEVGMRRVLVLVVAIGGAAGAADPPAGFDPNDVTKTHAWLVRARAALPPTPPGNELAAQRADDAFQKTLDAMTGKAVKWVVTVAGVDREGRIAVQGIDAV